MVNGNIELATAISEIRLSANENEPGYKYRGNFESNSGQITAWV